ncbi:hypothetical protein NDN01_24575 [Sphingomonas sp. QA11]|uniref:hypothetical protein n=1 Tax=Sphingomonas sp. QA11 TaxID=2950605 RepID=UPI002349D934|nr:hypothetical protein [Sphingomonas sp. QA11]WCM27118.1 hypothetical protein NDN01_24575 [Sphingomonas sp. QA11]
MARKLTEAAGNETFPHPQFTFPPEPAMSPAVSRAAVRPFLVAKDDEGVFRVTVRTTRYNSQGYPLVSAELLDEGFRTQTLAKAYVREQYSAEAGDIATK